MMNVIRRIKVQFIVVRFGDIDVRGDATMGRATMGAGRPRGHCDVLKKGCDFVQIV
jgi:hypothetical protein